MSFFGNGEIAWAQSWATVQFSPFDVNIPATLAEFVVPENGTISSLYTNVVVNTSTTDCSLTLFKNGSATSLAITAPALTTGIFSDLTDSVSVVAGDTIYLQGQQSTTGNIRGTISMKFS